MIRIQGELYITSGTKSQRDMTKLRIWSIVVSITLYTEVYSSVVMINSNSDLNVRVLLEQWFGTIFCSLPTHKQI